MDSQASDPASKKSRLNPLSEDPQMDRLAEILKRLPEDRQEAFGEWLEDGVTNKGENVTHDDSGQETTD
jgi:hypothetical protein